MSGSKMGRLGRLLAGMATAEFRTDNLVASASPAERQDDSRADRDALTGLLNRAGLIRELKSRTTGGDRLALLYFDLDRFGVVNDSLGYAIGDTLLKAVADRLRSACAPGDSIARIGGDEFVVIVVAPDTDSARAAGERIVAAVGDEAFFLGKEVALVSGSLGIAFSPDHGRELGPLLGEADAALYEAKYSGRGRCVVARTGLQPLPHAVSMLQGGPIRANAA